MNFISNLLGMLMFHAPTLRAQAERRAFGAGIASFSVGYLTFVLVRNSVYAALLGLDAAQTGLIASFFSLVRAVLFLLLIYIPAVIILSNAIAGDGLGLAVSRQEYRTHGSALLPLWGMIFLIDTPVQYFVPHFLLLGDEFLGITVGTVILLILIVVYTIWSIKQLNYLSSAQALGVFVLSWFTLPVYYILTKFLFAMPFFFLIILFYFGYQWFRSHFNMQSNDRTFQQHLSALTTNPQDADAHYQLGLIHLKRRNLDAARKCFESAIRIDSNDPEFHYSLGRMYELKGDWNSALEQYEETYRLDPEYSQGDIFREVGKGYLHTGSTEKGIEFLQYFLTNRGSDPEGRYWLAMALKEKGDIEQMRVQLNMIIEQARSNPRFFRKENREWIYRARSMIRDSRFEIRN